MKIIFFHHSSGRSGAQKSLTYLLKEVIKIADEEININLWVVKDGAGVERMRKLNIKTKITKGIVPFHGSTVTGMNLFLFVRNIISFLPSVIMSFIYFRIEKPDVVHLNSTSLFPLCHWSKTSES